MWSKMMLSKRLNTTNESLKFIILIPQILLKKNKYEKDGTDFEDKIDKKAKKMSDVTSLVKKADFNTKVTETEGKMPDVCSLVTKSTLTVVENKIPDVSNLFKKKQILIPKVLK